MWLWEEVQALPRQDRLVAALVWALMGLAGPALACDAALDAKAAPQGLALQVSYPCRPYSRIEISYGPLSLVEETGARGDVTVLLPVLSGVDSLSVQAEEGRWSTDVPQDQSITPFLWVEPELGQPNALPKVGFPFQDEFQAELAIYQGQRSPDHIDLPVSESNCAQRLTFRLLRDGWKAVRQVTLSLPGCQLVGTKLRLPLPVE